MALFLIIMGTGQHMLNLLVEPSMIYAFINLNLNKNLIQV